jgi:hypothetical protein
MKNILTLTLFLVLASSIVANTSELDKFNNTKSTISFTENKGQVSDQNYNPRPDVLFSGVANGLQFHIRKDGVSYQTSRVDSWKQKDENFPEGMSKEGITDFLPDQMTIYRTDMNWLGFNKDYTIETGASTAGFNNYYLPSCPNGAMNVRSYVDVTFKNLYAGIDVKWYEKNGELEYDFILAPNADYTKISWEIKGADRISIGENGQLIIETPLGNIEEQAPIAFQGVKQVKATWKIEGNNISFQLGSYNENRLLIIDPVVKWGTYYGGTGGDVSYSCATDASGNIYLSGDTRSTSGIATTGAHQTTYGGGSNDAFLVKFNSSGVRQWGTYYGGTGYDYSFSCATDASGNIYLSGYTTSTSGIATTGAHQDTLKGTTDNFLVKFNSSGVRQWGTYYGGRGYDRGLSCATDASGNIYLSGYTTSTSGIATTGAHQDTLKGSTDNFLVKFNSSGVRQWGTYYGGTGTDRGWSCATDTSGNIYLSGYTYSTSGIATTGAHQTTHGSGSVDAFLVKFNSSGVRQWGTYYGGTNTAYSWSCATDASGNIYLSGWTNSTSGIATTGAHQTTIGGSNDAFLVKFNSSGVRQWGTYYGGTGNEEGRSCATDASGDIYLSGVTRSTSGIATTGAHQTTNGGGSDAFLVKFNSSGVRQWGTYYGGTGNEEGRSCATDASGNIYLSGDTRSTSGIATTGAHQTTFRGSNNAFLVKFLDCKTSYSQDTITACDSYMWINNITYTSSNTSAKDTLVNAAGCDSVVTLNLTINNSNTGTDVQTACDSYKWIDGVTYTASNTSAKDTLVNAAGCDSVVTLNLTINNSTAGTDTHTACDSYKWIDGVTYTSSNTSAKDTLVNAAGCDSVVTLNLTINNSNTGTDVQTACDSYTWINNITYTSSNTSAKDTLVNAAGCDSVVTLNLTINTVNDSVYATGNTLTSVETGAQFQWLDCVFNYGILGGETGQSYVATANGSYAVQVTKNGCRDTSNCYVLKNVGLANSLKAIGIKVYPNPTSEELNITITNKFLGSTYKILDPIGKKVLDGKINNTNTTIDVSTLSKGYYLLQIGDGTVSYKFIVQ